MAFEQLPVSSPISFGDVKGYVQNLSDKFLMKPRDVAGIGGWVFDYEGETHVSVSAEITDHYVENNTAIQDHIAIRPLRVTLRGYVGEVVYKPSDFLAILNAIQDRLTSVPAYLGPLTPGGIVKAQKALTTVTNVAQQANQAYNRVKNVYSFFSGSSPSKTKQEKAFSHFLAMMNNRMAIVISTPYGSLKNMVIENVTMAQDEHTKSWSDVSVTLKQINVVPIASTSNDKNANRNAMQASSSFKKGITKGLTVSRTVLSFFFN